MPPLPIAWAFYLIARGGEPTVNKGSGDNPAIALLSVIGSKPPSKVTINEFTTIASVWTNNQFIDGTAIKGPPLALRIAAGNVPYFVEVRERFIESGGEDGVVVVEDKPVGMVRWYSFAQLLEGPGCSWMRGHVKVNKPARSVFYNHKHVKQLESRARDDAEVAGNNRLGVVLEKGGPALIAAGVAGRHGGQLWQILPDRARRHEQAEFQQQLVSNALLAPRGILASHPADQMLELRWNRWPAGLASPAPEKLEALAVPI